MPFSDGQFDVTAAVTTIEFTRNPPGVIREMVRCTKKPGGTVLLGVLNRYARINRKRLTKGIPPYGDAWFPSQAQLHDILSPYGIPEIRTTAFVPGVKWLSALAHYYNTLGTALRLSTGALIIGKIRL